MKQTYLCSNCKRIGLKTSKAMLFETFFCSKCNKNTTLFLSKPRETLIYKPKQTELKTAPVISAPVISAPVISAPVISAPVISAPVKQNSNLKLHHALLFIIGFISALLIMKK
jgi:hypothetical protein